MEILEPLCKIGDTQVVHNYRTARRVDGSVGMEEAVCTALSYQASQFHTNFEWYYTFVLKRVSKTGLPITLNYKHSELLTPQ